MKSVYEAIVVIAILGLTALPVVAGDVDREQIKGLDEQVQEIKSDVLAIAAELNQLEEKLLYPSHTQVALFLALDKGETFRLDAVEIRLDGQAVAHHLYSFKELEALQKGGVQRIFTGNIKTGEHQLLVSYQALAENGNSLERSGTYLLRKDIGPAIVEITLADRDISFSDR
jgi:hypothetical protein